MNLSVHRTSFNEYTTRNLPHELQRMSNSRLILLIVPQQSRCIAITALAAYLIGLRVKLVLCVQTLPDSCIVYGEKVSITKTQLKKKESIFFHQVENQSTITVFGFSYRNRPSKITIGAECTCRTTRNARECRCLRASRTRCNTPSNWCNVLAE